MGPRVHVRQVAAVAATVLLMALPAGAAAPASGVDSAVAWSGPVAARSLTVPGAQGGTAVYVVASFRLWIPSGGTWHIESATTATGVARASAPGSTYGRVGITHAVECGPDHRGPDGRLSTRSAYGLSGPSTRLELSTPDGQDWRRVTNGQGPVTKESALEVLREAAEDRLVLVIDHGTEFNEAFTQTLDIQFKDGVSTLA